MSVPVISKIDLARSILPAPKSIKTRDGEYRLSAHAGARLRAYDRDPEPVYDLFRVSGMASTYESLPGDAPMLTLDRPGECRIERAERILKETLAEIGDPDIAAQCYALECGEKGAVIAAGGEPGLFHGAVTLSKLMSPSGRMPAVSLADYPSVARRAVLLDVSRGRVPKLEALFEWVQLLAELKINQMTFNIEHAFLSPKHPLIGEGRDPLTPGEMAELDRYARDRHVEIVPFQQSLGHMRETLRKPRYAELAYHPELLWSLDPARDRTYDLLADLYDAQIEVTGSELFHAGCDEPFDLAKHFESARLGGRDLDGVIRDHLSRVRDMLHKRGRRAMFWADAVLAHPEMLRDLPGDIILCHWLYGSGLKEGPDHYRPGIEAIALAGLDFYACSTTWSFMKVHPDLEVARANLGSFIPHAIEAGAMGTMATIWGDMGHMNLGGLEPCPLAESARFAWEGAPGDSPDFKTAFSWTVHADPAGYAGLLAETMDKANRTLEGPLGLGGAGFLVLFQEPLDPGPLNMAAERMEEAAIELRAIRAECRRLLTRLERINARRRSWWLDFHLPLLQLGYLESKLSLIAFLKTGWPGSGDDGHEAGPQYMAAFFRQAADRSEEMAEIASDCMAMLESRWLAKSKTSDLGANRARYRRLVEAWQARADQFENLVSQIGEGALDAPPGYDEVALAPPGGYCFNLLAEMGLAELL